MEFGVDEPDMYEHAQDTRFRSLLDDIHDDPTGRGRPGPIAPLAMRPGGLTFQGARDQMLREADEPRAMQEAGLRDTDPNADFTVAEVQNRTELANARTGRDQHASPVGLLSGGSPYKKPWNVSIGEATITREPPAPPEPDAAVANPGNPIGAMSANTDSMQKSANADKPNYGRVEAAKVDPVSAGPAPAGGDKWLAGLRGAGSILMSAGGQAKQGMAAGLDAYGDYQDQERELREHGAKQAELDGAAARDQRSENRYASETNYGRARDEDSAFRTDERDRFQRGFMERGEARAEADTAYERDPARRQEGLDDYAKRKQIDLDHARKLRAGRGGAGNAQGRIAQYEAARQRLIALRGGEQNLTPEDKAQLQYAANDKDPGSIANKYADRIEGFQRQDEQIAGRMEQAQAKEQAKQQAAAQQAESSVRDLRELEKALERRISGGGMGRNALPDTFPGEGLARGAAGVLKQAGAAVGLPTFGQRPQPKQGETPEQYEARLGEFKRGELGPTGYSQDESTINSFGRLMGRSYYNTSTDNSANLASEQRVADEWARSNNSPEAMLERVRAQIAAETGAVQSGIHRAMRDPAGAPAQQAQVFTDPSEM